MVVASAWRICAISRESKRDLTTACTLARTCSTRIIAGITTCTPPPRRITLSTTSAKTAFSMALSFSHRTTSRSLFSDYLYNSNLVHLVLPTKHYRRLVDLLEVLMNSVDQLLLAGYADSSEHRTRHLAKLILDQIKPRTVFWGKHKNEPLGHGLQIAARLFGDVRGMVVQHQSNLMVLRIGAVQLL